MTPTCDHCKEAFELDAEETARVDNAKSKGRHAIIVKCPNCEMSTFGQWAEVKPKEPMLRCPVSACSGQVVQVNEGGRVYRGCGECGSQWKQAASPQQEITAIIKKFPYRKKCYRKAGELWVAAGSDSEAANYEERVAEEPDDPSDSYERD